MTNERNKEITSANRRQAIANTFATTASLGLVSQSFLSRTAHAAGSDVIKVGLVGCGGRGNGAAKNAMNADPGCQLTAIGDIFESRLQVGKDLLQRGLKDQFAVTDDHCFSGWDSFDKVLNSGIDVILLCTPPHFRPAQMAASVQAGKHIFCEKPVAVDATGVRSVMESSKLAASKGLSLVSGLCWRYDSGVLATMQRILDGAIGRVLVSQANYLASTLWFRNREPDWTPMHEQIQNWMYYRWLSGDHIVEQFIHSLDKALWLRHDEPPVSCYGQGGRQVRTSSDYGDVYDHFSVVYEWADGSKTFAATRQMEKCYNETQDYVIGTDGSARILKNEITSEKSWKFEPEDGKKESMYDLEHVALFKSIREGKPINNGDYMCKSTLMAIMGREACYTGKVIKWDQAMKSKQVLGPGEYSWGPAPEVKVNNPGSYDFA